MSKQFKTITIASAALLILLMSCIAVMSDDTALMLLALPLAFMVWVPAFLLYGWNTQRHWIQITPSGHVRVRSGPKSSVELIPAEGGSFSKRRDPMGRTLLTFRMPSGHVVRPKVMLGGSPYFDGSKTEQLVDHLATAGLTEELG